MFELKLLAIRYISHERGEFLKVTRMWLAMWLSVTRTEDCSTSVGQGWVQLHIIISFTITLKFYFNYNYTHYFSIQLQLHCFKFSYNYIMRNQIYSAFVNYIVLHFC